MVDIARTAKGTATSKISGTTLSLASVSMNQEESLVVGVAYDTGQGAPIVTWGNRVLDQIVTRAESGAATALFLLRHINNTRTRTITCTWGGAIVAKAMFATMVEGAKVQDVSAGATSAATADPNTGIAATSTVPNTIQISAMASQGPSSDTVGTVGDGHTSGQRAGTSGASPTSNITIHETFEILSATGDVRASKTGATSRSWANVILAVKESLRFRQGITPSDLRDAEIFFDTAGANWRDHGFRFNAVLDQWEVYDVTDIGTLIASRPNTDSIWE